MNDDGLRTFQDLSETFKLSDLNLSNCNLCDLNQIGTSLHIMWECPSAQNVWQQTVKPLSDALGLEI